MLYIIVESFIVFLSTQIDFVVSQIFPNPIPEGQEN